MKKFSKQILVTFSVLSLFATVGICINHQSINTHAAHIDLGQVLQPWEKRDGINSHWAASAKYNSINPNHIEHIRKGHHVYMIKPTRDTAGEIIGMDRNTHVSNAKVFKALRQNARHNSKYRRKHSHIKYYRTRKSSHRHSLKKHHTKRHERHIHRHRKQRKR